MPEEPNFKDPTATLAPRNEALPDPTVLTAPIKTSNSQTSSDSETAISGQVTSQDMSPEHFVVALFSMKSDGPSFEVSQSTNTDSQGRFRLQPKQAGSHALVILSGSETEQRIRPVTRRIEIQLGSPQDLGTISTTSDFSISGKVVDAAGVPIAGAKVKVVPKQKGHQSRANAFGLIWLDNRFEHSEVPFSKARHVAFQADEDGNFRVEGLAPREYRVSANRLGNHPKDGIPHRGFSRSKNAKLVTAPSVNVYLKIKSHFTLFQVTGAGQPIQANLTTRDGDDLLSSQTNQEGFTRIEWPEEKPLDAEFSAPDFTAQRKLFSAQELAKNEVIAIDLKPGAAPAELGIRFSSSVEQALAEYTLAVVLYRIEEDPTVGRERLQAWSTSGGANQSKAHLYPSPSLRADLQRSPNEIKVTTLEPGDYWLRVVPRWTQSQEPAPPLLGAVERIELRPGELSWVDWTPQLGGYLELDVQLSSHANVRWTLADANGETIPAQYSLKANPGSTSSNPRIPGVSWLCNPLLPGTYSISASSRGQIDKTTFEILPGNTTTVPLDLSEL